MFVTIERGLYIMTVNAALLGSSLALSDHDVPHYLEFELHDAETGKKATGNYRGPATITKENGKTRIIVGDTVRSATLSEYIVADQPTRESEERLAEFVSGLEGGFSGKRLSARASYDFREGFKEGKKLR